MLPPVSVTRLLNNLLYCQSLNISSLIFFLKHLKDPHSSVRCQCLCLIGHLTQGTEGSSMHMEPGSQGGTVQSLLASFSEDSDPRVRTSALQALVGEKNPDLLQFLFYCIKC